MQAPQFRIPTAALARGARKKGAKTAKKRQPPKFRSPSSGSVGGAASPKRPPVPGVAGRAAGRAGTGPASPELVDRVCELARSMSAQNRQFQLLLEENTALQRSYAALRARLTNLRESSDAAEQCEMERKAAIPEKKAEDAARDIDIFSTQKVYFQGEIMKEGANVKSWKGRWCVLTESMIGYGVRGERPRGVFRLGNATLRPFRRVEGVKFACMEIELPDYQRTLRFFSGSAAKGQDIDDDDAAAAGGNDAWFSQISNRIISAKYKHQCEILMQIPNPSIVEFLDWGLETSPAPLLLNGQALSFQLVEIARDIVSGVAVGDDGKRLPIARPVSRFECKDARLSASKVATLLTAALNNVHGTLKFVDFSGNVLDETPATLEALKSIKKLRSMRAVKLRGLALSRCGMGRKGAKILGKFIARMQQTLSEREAKMGVSNPLFRSQFQSDGATLFCSQLNFSGNPLGEDGCEVLCAALAPPTRVSVLDLTQCGIGDRGFAAVAQLLSRQPRLLQLDIGGNPAGDKGVEAVCAAAQQHRHIQQLCLAEMDRLTERGAALLAHLAQRNGSLKRLVFLQDELDEIGLRILRTLYRGNVSS